MAVNDVQVIISVDWRICETTNAGLGTMPISRESGSFRVNGSLGRINTLVDSSHCQYQTGVINSLVGSRDGLLSLALLAISSGKRLAAIYNRDATP